VKDNGKTLNKVPLKNPFIPSSALIYLKQSTIPLYYSTYRYVINLVLTTSIGVVKNEAMEAAPAPQSADS